MLSQQVLVIMPLYNAHAYVKRAIESILCQTYTNFQFLIINDGSTDGSEKIARSYEDKRIQVWDQINSGPGAVMNRALQYACVEQIPFLARMDADDLSESGRLAEQLKLLQEDSQAAACSSNCYYIDSDAGKIISTSTVSGSPRLIRWEILHGLRGLIQGACMFRTDALSQIGGYRVQFPLAEDSDVFLRLSERFDLINSLDFLYRIRLRSDSISVKNVHRNILFQFYALDCSFQRRKGKPERKFEYFEKSPGWPMRYRIWREEQVLRLWREGMNKRGLISKLVASFIDPRRAAVRGLRKINAAMESFEPHL